MIIGCPSCRTRYRVSPDSLGPEGRVVRCSGCGERWFAEPPAAAAGDPPPLAPPTAPPPAAPAAAARAGVRGRWSALTAAAALLAGLVLGRDAVVAWQPRAAALYRGVGLPVGPAPPGVEFRRLASARRADGGNPPALVVSGEIANISAGPRAVPAIRVGLLDAQGREIDHALFDAPSPSLAAGAAEPFELKLDAPPAEARDFSLSFAERP